MFCNANNVDGNVTVSFALDPQSVKNFNPKQIQKQLNSLFQLEAIVTYQVNNQKYQFIRRYSYNQWDKFYGITDSTDQVTRNFDDFDDFSKKFFRFDDLILPDSFNNSPIIFHYELGSRNFPPIFEIFDKNICNIVINDIKLIP